MSDATDPLHSHRGEGPLLTCHLSRERTEQERFLSKRTLWPLDASSQLRGPRCVDRWNRSPFEGMEAMNRIVLVDRKGDSALCS